MGMRVLTNTNSLSAQRILANNLDRQRTSLDRLSSGSRIIKSADDAAGLAISEKLKAEIRSIRQATRNANDGVSLIQVAEGSMTEVSNILIRLRELSIQAASDGLGDVERSFVDKEVQQLKSEIDRISAVTEFNGRKLLDGSSPTLEFQVGTHNNPILDRFIYDSSSLSMNVNSLGLAGVSTLGKANAQQNLTMLDNAIEHLNGSRAVLGALQNRMQSTISNLGIYRENLENAHSRIRDTDIAEESSELTKNNILTQANVAILAQANAAPQLALKLIT